MKSIAFLHYEGEPNSEIQKNEFLLFFAQKGITVHDVEVFSDEDLKKKLTAIISGVDMVYFSCDNPLIQHEKTINQIAAAFKKPVFSCAGSVVRRGGMLHIGADYRTVGRLTAVKAVQILNGAESLRTDVIENPYIIINLKSAEELGIAVPDAITSAADEVIS